MIAFIVSVTTESARYEYPAIAAHVIDLQADAIDRFGPCKFKARPA